MCPGLSLQGQCSSLRERAEREKTRDHDNEQVLENQA